MPKVSVIIPTYNRAHLLMRAVNSVLHQTFQDFEIIIVDDASSDNTMELVKGIIDKRIAYLRHETNRGGSAARNTGIQHAIGEYIAFLDSDDEWLPKKLELQLKKFKGSASKLGVVYTGFIKEAQRSQSVIPKLHGDLFQSLLVKNYVGTTSTPLIKKDCFLKVGRFDETLPSAQDWDMWIRIAQFYEFDFVPEVLVRCYRQEDSISKNKTAVSEGQKMVLQKYQHYIKALPKKLQAEHYFYMGINFWWKGNMMECCNYFIKSIFLHPSAIQKIIHFFIQRIRSIFFKMIAKA